MQVGKSVVGPRTFLTVKNFFGIIVLQFVGHLLGGSMVGLMVISSKRAYATPRYAAPRAPAHISMSRPLLTHISAGDKHSKAGLAQSLWDSGFLVMDRVSLRLSLWES